MFSKRSEKAELLDQSNIPKADLFVNLEELDYINRRLGGHKATIIGLKSLVKDKSRVYKIVDFACGGGDTLREIYDFGLKEGFKFQLYGFDILEDAIEFSRINSEGKSIKWIVSDFKDFELEGGFDIAINALCCHHLYKEDLKILIRKMYDSARIGFIINDLHRHPIAYYGIAILTNILSRSYLVKHDAKLSVLKGFKKNEWQVLFSEMGIENYRISWIWAFRHLIVFEKQRDV